MIRIFTFITASVTLSLLISPVQSDCPMCQNGMRYMQMGGAPIAKRYSFNFDQFFSQGQFANNRFHSYGSPRQPSRIFNSYGQDAESFGSAIGKSIGQRILQVLGQPLPTTAAAAADPMTAETSPIALSSLSPTSLSPSTSPTSYDIQFTAPSSPAYGISSTGPSTHPPEDLPTVQQAYQQQSLSTPSLISYQSNNNGFGGIPGLLPPPGSSSNGDLTNCPWCNNKGGYRNKRGDSEEKKE